MTAPRDANVILGLLWPWGEIRRLQTELAFSEHREECWRTAYYSVSDDYHAALARNEGLEAALRGLRKAYLRERGCYPAGYGGPDGRGYAEMQAVDAALDRLGEAGKAEMPGGLLGRHEPRAGIPVAAFGAEVAS